MEKSLLIVLDFDHTLFNTTAYVAALKEALVAHGVTPEEFDAHREALKNCCNVVDIDSFVQRVSAPNKKELHDAIHAVIQQQAPNFVFDDVLPFLERHAPYAEFLMVTKGDRELQTEKTTHSGLAAKMPVVIVPGEKASAFADVVDNYAHVVFIDDKAAHIDEVKQAYPKVTTYFMQRPEDRPYADRDTHCDCADVVLTDLSLTIPPQ